MKRFRIRFDKETLQQMKTKKWWGNYWFYYKWPTILVLAVLVLGGTLLYSMMNQMEYDATIYLVCRSKTAAALDTRTIQNKFADYAGDYDGKDGINIRFGFSALPVPTEEDLSLDGLESQVVRPEEETDDIREYLAATTTLAGEMDSDTAIYIFDDDQYDEMNAATDHPVFIDLSKRYPDLPIVDGCKLMVRDTIFANDFELVSDDLFFAVRDLTYLRGANKKQVQEHYAYQMELFDAIVKASFPEK